jgi:hypothetical protein
VSACNSSWVLVVDAVVSGVATARLVDVGKASVAVPPSVKVHARLVSSHIDSRKAQIESRLACRVSYSDLVARVAL